MRPPRALRAGRIAALGVNRTSETRHEENEMSYQRISPDHSAWVREIANAHPVEWEAARKGEDGHRDDRFIRILAFALHQRDSNIGLNGKRGGDEISRDALSYKNPTAPGGCEVIDVIVGASHTPAWQDVTIPPGSPDAPDGVLGKFIQPVSPSEGGGPIDGATTPARLIIDIAPALAPLQQQIAQLTRDVAALRQQLADAQANAAVPRRFKASMKSVHGKFVALTPEGKVEANRDAVGGWETITFEPVE
jgi:hypothetical protein